MAQEYLPNDRVLLDRVLVNKIVALGESVVGVGKFWGRERFAESDTEDIAVSTIADPGTPDIKRTDIIQMGIPTVSETPYTGDECTQLDFTYPFTFDLEVVDSWSVEGFEFSNSRDKAMAIFLRFGALLKQNITLGFYNCVHTYLQQTQAGTTTLTDEEGGGRFHEADWSLTVRITAYLG